MATMGGSAARLAAQVVGVRGVDLRAVAAEQLERDARVAPGARRSAPAVQREAQHGAEAVADAHGRRAAGRCSGGSSVPNVSTRGTRR
jgi:hypothetical protein